MRPSWLVMGLLLTSARLAWAGLPLTMLLDADPDEPEFQVTRTATGTFEISLESTGQSGKAQGYQWMLQWTDAVLELVSWEENVGGTEATACATGLPAEYAPPGKARSFQGTGCISVLDPMLIPSRLVTVTLECVVDDGSTTEVHIVTGGDGVSGEDPIWGGMFFAWGGTPLPPVYGVDLEITCGSAEPDGGMTADGGTESESESESESEAESESESESEGEGESESEAEGEIESGEGCGCALGARP